MLNQVISHMSFVDIINLCVLVFFTACYGYQIVYVFIALCKKPPVRVASKNHRYAVMISARNESAVIADLLQSINRQNYPQDLIDIFVIADNCTDNTAAIARDNGAVVFERFDEKLIGKGYALDHGYSLIQERYGNKGYEAYFVFDADNVLDHNYFREMNVVFDSGAPASTSYRNSKNFDSNWISAGYGVWFMREAKYLSQSRLTVNTSCAVSGTGFFISADVLKESGGWKWHLLTEDIEFSTQSIILGRRISYCSTAVLYDEQPTSFRDSWNQRFRWAKGFYQVFGRYGAKLAKGIFTNPRGYRFACYDMLMTIAPGMLLTVVVILLNLSVVFLGITGHMTTGVAIASSISSVLFCILNYMLIMFMFGALTTFTEWDNIRTTSRNKIKYMFTFPLFMITYIPIAVVALFKKADWKPIKHSISVNVDDFSKSN